LIIRQGQTVPLRAAAQQYTVRRRQSQTKESAGAVHLPAPNALLSTRYAHSLHNKGTVFANIVILPTE
jgi:hypothetical protein